MHPVKAQGEDYQPLRSAGEETEPALCVWQPASLTGLLGRMLTIPEEV